MKRRFGDDDVWLDHEGIVRTTEKAIAFRIHGEVKWIPKSCISDHNEEVVAVKAWFADKEGYKSDYI